MIRYYCYNIHHDNKCGLKKGYRQGLLDFGEALCALDDHAFMELSSS